MRVVFVFIVLCAVVISGGCVGSAPKSRYLPEAQRQLGQLADKHPEAVFVHSLNELPVSVREQLEGVADAGQPFSIGCTGPHPHMRLLLGICVGHKYTIAVEQGGYAYTWFMWRFVVNDEGKVIVSSTTEADGAVKPYKGALSADEAGRLARQLANDKSRELYECEPFQTARPAQMEQGLWVWHDHRGWGSGDMEATVKFAADGSAPEVKVFRLFNETR